MIKVENIKNYRIDGNKEIGIYVGRYNRSYGLEGSILRNRFDEKTYGRSGCIKAFKKWLWVEIKRRNKEVMEELERIRRIEEEGRFDVVLLCWCKPLACHGDVIKSCIEWMIKDETWFEFMDRAKENGISPTRQEEIDREKGL